MINVYQPIGLGFRFDVEATEDKFAPEVDNYFDEVFPEQSNKDIAQSLISMHERGIIAIKREMFESEFSVIQDIMINSDMSEESIEKACAKENAFRNDWKSHLEKHMQ